MRRACTNSAGRFLLAALCLALAHLPGGRAGEHGRNEYEVKAAWLFNFARYTDWPAAAFASPEAPVVVGIVGRDPFGPQLENTFSGKAVQGRSVVLKRLSADQDFSQCHLVFIAASEKRRQRELLGKLKGTPVLTLGEADDFLDQGGTVQFTLRGEELRFAVNLNAAKDAKLRVSANVLKLASSVRGRYE